MQTNPASATQRLPAVWLVLFSAAGAFMLTLGVRQTMGLFLSPLNSATGLGIGSISLAFACGQLGWGLTQPFAGAIAGVMTRQPTETGGRLPVESLNEPRTRTMLSPLV